MQGKIIRGVGGFYYVHVPSIGLLECKAKGAFLQPKGQTFGWRPM